MKNRFRIVVVALLQVAVSAAILTALLRGSNWHLLKTTLARVDRTWFGLAIAVLVAQQILGALRWRDISGALGGPRISRAFYILWQGMAVLLLQVLPSTIGGDVLRAASGARHDRLGRGIGVVVVDRVIGMGALSGIVAVGSIVFWRLLFAQPALLVPLGMAIAGIGGCAVVMMLARLLGEHRLTAILGSLGRALLSSLRGALGAWIAGISLVIHLLSVVAVLCLMHAARAPWGAALFFVAPAAFLVSAIPISLGGWGVREGAFVVGLGLLGAQRETSISVSVLFGVSLTLAGLVLTLLGGAAYGAAYMASRGAPRESDVKHYR